MADFDPKAIINEAQAEADRLTPDTPVDTPTTPGYGMAGTGGGLNPSPLMLEKDPYTDGTPADGRPVMSPALLFRDQGSLGLRQYGGWVREEFLRALQGREAARVYREMKDNSATIGAMLFAIEQTIREISWKVEPAGDDAESRKWADFAESLMGDMRSTWDEFVVEALSMLPYGYSPHEIIFKKRDGQKDPYWGGSSKVAPESSKYDDGLVGVADMPLRGQETVLRWFFDNAGQITGMQQQPWIGPLINIPSFKLMLFRPQFYKGNPEGRSVLRNAYRGYFFSKRIEEEEAILFERMNGLPVLRVPSWLLEQEKAGIPAAASAMQSYRMLVTNTRIDEQMGVILPSDMWPGENGPSGHRMYEFELMVPSGSHMVDPEKVLGRYSLDILKTCMADFIDLGHQARGTQNLAISKVDMFFNAIRGWLNGMGEVINRSMLHRVWYLNGIPYKFMPRYVPDLAQRIDLDAIGNFVMRLSQSGARMFPDDDLENYLRESAGMPALDTEQDYSNTPTGVPQPQHRPNKPGPDGAPLGSQPERNPSASSVAKLIADAVLKNRVRESRGQRYEMRRRTEPTNVDGDPPPHSVDGLSEDTITE